MADKMRAKVDLQLDADLEARVKKFASGVGVPLSEVIERALVFALTSRYPGHDLPSGGGRPDNELPSGGRPDNSLPGSGGRPDNSLPGSGGRPDNELPSGGGRPDQGLPEGGGRPDQSLPGGGGGGGGGRCPVFDPTVDNELPDGEIPTPKRK